MKAARKCRNYSTFARWVLLTCANDTWSGNIIWKSCSWLFDNFYWLGIWASL